MLWYLHRWKLAEDGLSSLVISNKSNPSNALAHAIANALADTSPTLGWCVGWDLICCHCPSTYSYNFGMICCGEILSIIIIIIVLSHKQTIKSGDYKEPSLVMGIFTGHTISEASASLPQSPAQTTGNERGMRLVRMDGFATFFCTPVDVWCHSRQKPFFSFLNRCPLPIQSLLAAIERNTIYLEKLSNTSGISKTFSLTISLPINEQKQISFCVMPQTIISPVK